MEFTLQTLIAEAAKGEDSKRKFKRDLTNADSLAAEMAAFANANGGVIFVGVEDNGHIHGLSAADVARVNQLISNAAIQNVRSPLFVRTENILLENGNVVIAITVPERLDKPYFDRNGVIWFKNGADKRRINSKEELRRLFQISGQFHADELPTKADISKLDKLLFRDFLEMEYKEDIPDNEQALIHLLRNMNLAVEDGHLNLAGVLLFARKPEWIFPQFIVKGASFPGETIHIDNYMDMEDIFGPLPTLFKSVYSFVMRNLHKVQANNGVNSPGTPEIPGEVFEELLVNALVHRDYLYDAPIRIFFYSNRVEIINPGNLANRLTIENIKTDSSNIRNPIIVSCAAKGLLPYRGIGSGIIRALTAWPHIDFVNDKESAVFKAIVYRKIEMRLEIGAYLTAMQQESLSEHQRSLLRLMHENPRITVDDLAVRLRFSKRTIQRHISQLKKSGFIQRQGHSKGGEWIIINKPMS